MLIKELIRLNTNAKFFSDVQLRWFWDAPKNAELAKGYIFTRQAGAKQKSTVDALEMMRFGLIDPGCDNRMLFMATFGQGKTHLALALANLFAKPADSDEVRWLIESLKHAYGGSPGAQNFIDLKEQYPRHLVVCLQGDTGNFDLASYFVSELQRSLASELSASGGVLPLWYKTAIDTLDASVVAQWEKADAFLEPHNMDLASLHERLRQAQDVGLYDLVRDLIEHVTGVPPALGPRLALHELIDYVCGEYCGTGKPYAGLVVLFDEFNAFLHSYSKQDAAGTPLQALLNGIHNNKGKALFVGFAQRDPKNVIDAVLDGSKRAGLMVEMSRIQPGQRVYLFNNLETVLDAYVDGDARSLRRELEPAGAWPTLEEAEQDTLILFRNRYDRELKWGAEQFRSRVTLGCFPLHPVTTALLCAVELADTGAATPRGILQFVFKCQQELGDSPVALNGRPTWVRATQMVDWFEQALCANAMLWDEYRKALSDGGGDLTEAQREVLKAMLLHKTAGLATASVPYERAIALLAGIMQEEARAALEAMAERNVIEHDTAAKKYVFLSVSGGDRGLRDYLNRETVQTVLSLATLQDEDTLAGAGLGPTAVPVEWGNSQDWQAQPTLLTSEYFTADNLQRLLERDLAPVVWLVPQDEEEKTKLAAGIQTLIDGICGSLPKPLTVFLPDEPFPGIHTSLKKLQVLANMPREQKTEYLAYIPGAKKRADDQLKDQVRHLRASAKKWFAATALTPALQAQNIQGDLLVKQVVLDCFKKAPPSFVQQLREDSPKLRAATSLLGKLLLGNEAVALKEQIRLRPRDGNLSVAETILETILTVGRPNAWGIVTTSKHIQEPAHHRVKLAWEEMDKAFPINGAARDLKEVLELLRQPSYGYRPNALTLLLCAWIGQHRHDLEVSRAGALLAVANLKKLLDQDRPATFVQKLIDESYRLKLNDRSAALQEIQAILTRVQKIHLEPLTRQEAAEAITKLGTYLSDEGNSDEGMRSRVAETKDRVQDDLGLADGYDAKAQEVLVKIVGVKEVTAALTLLKRARELPSVSGVKPMQPPFADVVASAEAKLEVVVDETCQRLAKLTAITEFGQQERDLQTFSTALADKTHLQNKVTAALAKLLQARTDLEARQSENARLAEINAFSTRVSVLEMRESLKVLATMTGGSEKVVARQTAKQQELEERIAALMASVEGLAAKVEAVASDKELRALEQEIACEAVYFVGDAPSEEKRKAALGRCTQLEEFFAAAAALGGKELRSPEDVKSVAERCAALRQRYATILAPTQAGQINQIEAALHRQVESKQQSALGWLLEHEKRWQAGAMPPAAFLQTLEHPPQFLPGEAEAALSRLQAQVQDRLEGDEEGWIVERFQGITDKARRERLVKKLQEMLTPG